MRPYRDRLSHAALSDRFGKLAQTLFVELATGLGRVLVDRVDRYQPRLAFYLLARTVKKVQVVKLQ
jgi:hypothetical protein